MLINMKSRLTDLKFGNDQPGYGSSGEPFVQTSIPGIRGSGFVLPIYRPGTTGGLDYPNRGGAPYLTTGLQTVSKFNDIDRYRIEKFLKSAPRGTAFIQKQIGLQLSNPKTEVNTTSFGPGEYGPLEITRVYNSSNTLQQVSVQGTGVHGVRHGFTAFPINQKNYFATVSQQLTLGLQGENIDAKEKNRLLSLWTLKLNNGSSTKKSSDFGINPNTVNTLGISFNKGTLFQYLGGPNSVYGLGSTVITRVVDTTKLGVSIFSHVGRQAMTYDLIKSQKINDSTREYSKNKEYQIQDFRNQLPSISGSYVPWQDWNPDKNVSSINNGAYSRVLNEAFLKAKRDGYQNIAEKESPIGGRSAKVSAGGRSFSDFQGTNFRGGTQIDTFYSRISQADGRVDNINSIYPFQFDNKDEPWNVTNGETNDLIKFVFEAISNDDPTKSTAIFFRAFLKGDISDSNSGKWNSFNYFGRGEEFYTYQGFTRTMGFSFTVAAQSYQELQPMYNRLNALISQVYPDYSTAGIMRAPLVRLTIGDYIYRMAGFLENVNVTLSQEAGWEIEEGVQLPFKAEVQVSFKPIPEDLPRRYNPKYAISRLIAQNSKTNFIKDAALNQTDALNIAKNSPISENETGTTTVPVETPTIPPDVIDVQTNVETKPQTTYYTKAGLL